jgi:hypothetical protein
MWRGTPNKNSDNKQPHSGSKSEMVYIVQTANFYRDYLICHYLILYRCCLEKAMETIGDAWTFEIEAAKIAEG